MIYTALLRGINVGGRNKIDMKKLKQTFEQAGMEAVVTYLNTGNIIFYQNRFSPIEITQTLEQAIYEDFDLQIKVIVRSFDSFKLMMKSLPKEWENDPQMKSDVLFLWEEIDHEGLLDKLVINPDVDTVKYTPGAVLWSVAREHVLKSGMNKLAGTKNYKKMTIRNVNTTRKIYALMQEADLKQDQPDNR